MADVLESVKSALGITGTDALKKLAIVICYTVL